LFCLKIVKMELDMALGRYKQKRRFTETPEPAGQIKTKGSSRFVVHKHQASHLHYDFRLELPAYAPWTSAGKPKKIGKGKIVLKSWAVPKGVPEKPSIKHLAVAVEDHPVDYLNFEGIIPEGNYGAGRVEIWDKGKFKLIEYTQKFLEFELEGKRLRGKYVLAQFTDQKKNWLIFKMKS